MVMDWIRDFGLYMACGKLHIIKYHFFALIRFMQMYKGTIKREAQKVQFHK